MSWAAIGPVGLQVLLSDPATSTYIAKSACHVVSVLWPVYRTFKAIEGHDLEKWLAYWCIHGCLTLFEESLQRVPFYYHGKLLFVIWLLSPSTQGTKRLYTSALKPILSKYQDKLDAIAKFWQTSAVAVYCDAILQIVDGYVLWFFDGDKVRK